MIEDAIEVQALGAPSAVPESSMPGSMTAARTLAHESRRRTATAVSPSPSGSPSEGPPRIPIDDYDAPEPASALDSAASLGLTLGDAIAVAPATLPAPTTTPVSKRVTGEDTARAIEASIRAKDADIGLGNPEENAVAVAVQVAGRATPVESGTRARFAVDIDRDGGVVGVELVSASRGASEVWADTLASIRASLSKKPVYLGPEAKRKGVRVVVDATVLHVFASGSDKYVTVGPCPSMHLVGGETTLSLSGPSANASPFFGVGGAAFGEAATGMCALGDPQSLHKQIVVRTRTSVVFPNEKPAPPPLDSFPRPPKPKPLSLWRLIFDKH